VSTRGGFLGSTLVGVAAIGVTTAGVTVSSAALGGWSSVSELHVNAAAVDFIPCSFSLSTPVSSVSPVNSVEPANLVDPIVVTSRVSVFTFSGDVALSFSGDVTTDSDVYDDVTGTRVMTVTYGPEGGAWSVSGCVSDTGVFEVATSDEIELVGEEVLEEEVLGEGNLEEEASEVTVGESINPEPLVTVEPSPVETATPKPVVTIEPSPSETVGSDANPKENTSITLNGI
jgi:hypothetical protein